MDIEYFSTLACNFLTLIVVQTIFVQCWQAYVPSKVVTAICRRSVARRSCCYCKSMSFGPFLHSPLPLSRYPHPQLRSTYILLDSIIWDCPGSFRWRSTRSPVVDDGGWRMEFFEIVGIVHFLFG